MKTYELLISGNPVIITTDYDSGAIDSDLPRLVCPSCDSPTCFMNCDGSQGADENNDETEDDALDRQRFNAFVDGLESIILAHACAGIEVNNPKYIEGIVTALQSAEDQFN